MSDGLILWVAAAMGVLTPINIVEHQWIAAMLYGMVFIACFIELQMRKTKREADRAAAFERERL